MTITLGYVEGINRIDTPYFSTIEEQSNWFEESGNLVTINTTFYPPHYTNRIRLDSNEIDLQYARNYLWFTYKNKTYYYFIDNITYINENLIEISITMDYIQTYMFDIMVINGIIERKFINRWIRPIPSRPWLINRSYIRENVSCGLFEKGSKNGTLLNEQVLVLKCTGLLGDIYSGSNYEQNSLTNKGATDIINNDNRCVSPFKYVFCFPDYKKLSYQGREYDIDPSVIQEYLSSPVVVDAYYLPMGLFNDYFTPSGNTIILHDVVDGSMTYGPHLIADSTVIANLSFCGVEFGTNIPLGLRSYCKFDLSPYTYTPNNYDFTRNSSISVLFNAMYMPVLLDENYIYDKFGNNSSNVDYPTHYLSGVNETYYVECDLTNGSLVFSINLPTYEPTNLDTTVIDTNIVNSELINDPWKEYVANNKNRWASAGLQAGMGAIDTFVSVVSNTYFSNKAINRVLRDGRTPKRLKTSAKALKEKEMMTDRYTQKNIDYTVSGISSMVSPLVNQAITDTNMQQAPKGVKQSCSYTSILARDKYVYYQIYKVRDYQQCAHYYHRNGYHVEEYIDKLDLEHNIFDYVNTRYYFNVLKMSEVVVDIEYMCDNDTIDGITSRLLEGIRLWNVVGADIEIGQYKYDNVEKSFLP